MCVLYLVSEGTKLRKNGGRFLIENDGKRIQSVPINEVESVVVRRCAEISTPALYELFEKNAGVFYVDGRGRLMGQMEVPSGSLLRFEKQRENFFDDEKSVCMIRSTIGEKLSGQIELLRYYARQKKEVDIAQCVKEIRRIAEKLRIVRDKEELRGLEGLASRTYFAAFPYLLDTSVWVWNGRNRRPPQDPVNALLSYGYAFLEREVRMAVIGAGLDGRMGFFHSNNGRKDSLVFDLMEPFRQRIIDRFVLKLLNRKQFKPEDFSYIQDGGCCLRDEARHRWIECYESYMIRPMNEYGGAAPRKWLREWVHNFARGIFREQEEAV